jgi:hypothetical protein
MEGFEAFVRCSLHLRTGLVLLLALRLPLAAQEPTHISYPWVVPGDFKERLLMSDLVIAATMRSTSRIGLQSVDGIELTALRAECDVDRVFKGQATDHVRFTWFSFAPPPKDSGGVVGSTPPIASFRSGTRYLVFLRRQHTQWVVSVPLYALEVALASPRSSGQTGQTDLSQAPPVIRNQAIAEELETAALLLPEPKAGMTGFAPWYFPPVFDLIGGCAKPFFRRFLSSRSAELRAAAERWLALITDKKLTCGNEVPVGSN